MPKVYQTLLEKLEEELKLINLEEDDILKKSERSFHVTLKTIEKLKQKATNSRLTTQDDEIYFFKEVKPQFVSKLIYHISVFNMESNKPHGSIDVKRKYYNNELDKLKKYFDNNLEFYRYYRTHSNYLDHKYFIRGKQDIRLTLDSFFFESDPVFSTSHDFKISKILANDLLNVYLEDELKKLDMRALNNRSQEPRVKLT